MFAPTGKEPHTLPHCLFSSLGWKKVVFFMGWHERGSFFFSFFHDQTTSFHHLHLLRDVRRPLRKTYIYLVPSLIYLPPPTSLCLTGCWADWLPGWLAPSLTGLSLALHSHTVWASLGLGWRETVGLAQALGSRISARFFSLSGW